MNDAFVHRGHDDGGPGDEVGASGRGMRRLLPALLAGLFALSLLSAMAAPLLLDRSATGRNDEAKNLLLGAASQMDSCAERAGGSYARCDAGRMREFAPGIEWREGVAPYGKGWGDGRVGRVYVSVAPGATSSYKLQTTSGSGYVFSYSYSGGSVTKTAEGSSEPEPW